MSVAQGGNGFPFLAEPVYDYLCTGRSTGISISVTDIPDPTLQFVAQKVWYYMMNIISVLHGTSPLHIKLLHIMLDIEQCTFFLYK